MFEQTEIPREGHTISWASHFFNHFENTTVLGRKNYLDKNLFPHLNKTEEDSSFTKHQGLTTFYGGLYA